MYNVASDIIVSFIILSLAYFELYGAIIYRDMRPLLKLVVVDQHYLSLMIG